MNLRLNIFNKLLLIVILTTVIPLAVIGWVGYRSTTRISDIASETNREVAELAMTDSSAALSTELKSRLRALTARHAGDVNEILKRVEADTLKLADFAEYLYRHGDTLGRYARPSTYEPAPEYDSFGSRQPNQSSWLAVFGESVDEQGQVSAALLEEIKTTEYMDILFRSIAATNPYAVQLYINTASQLSRGMPFIDGDFEWVDGPKQFSESEDVTAYDFYYLADAEHNPDRGPEWTELYWDPAGLGWMVSSIAPVYAGDTLKAVTGIDITLSRIIDSIINLQIEQTGFAFLMSDRGQAIAFPERAAEFLAFAGSLQGEFKRNEAFAHMLTQVRGARFQAIIQAMLAGEQGLTRYPEPRNGGDYFVAYHPIPITGWSVGIVVPEQEVIAPAVATQQKIEANRELTAAELHQRSTNLVQTHVWFTVITTALLIPLAFFFARSISRPIRTLAEGTRRLGSGELDHRMRIRSGDEIEDFAVTFNQMASDLQTKIDEIETANRELTQLDQLKSRFISMASHELRTPLIAIQGYVDLIREGRAGEVSPTQRHMLETVARNTTRLARIVTELLDVSRIEENKLVLERQAVSLPAIVREIVEEQQPYLDSRGHSLSLDLPANLPMVDADPDRLAQVVINLFGNAIKYTPDNGHIQIRATAEVEQVHLSVVDNGIGIKDEDKDKLFKRFSTLGDITKHRTGKNEFLASGTGLGLAIVAGIVKAHGGEIWVDSTYKQGSTFHVTLPTATAAQLAAAEKAAPAPTAAAPTAAERDTAADAAGLYKVIPFKQPQAAQIRARGDQAVQILVIDDEPDAITFTRDLLADRYEIHGAQTSATGLREALQHKPNLVLLDAWIPGISGYDVCRTLKRNSNTQDIPVIIFTAATQEVDQERAREAGADGFVTKPFRREQIVELIESFKESA